MARADAAQLPRAQVRTFPGDLHDVLDEHDRDVVHDEVAAFVTASIGSRSAPPPRSLPQGTR